MSMKLEELVVEISVSRRELTTWIERRWVLPIEEGGQYLFDEADQARVRLIAELRRDMAVNDEAVPVILKLLDQVYALREAMSELQHAIAALPEEMRREINSRLREAPKD